MDEEEKNFSIKTAGSIFPVMIMYTRKEMAKIIIDMPKHPPKHPMANSLLIWFMEYLINSNNVESHLSIFCQYLKTLFIYPTQIQGHRKQQKLGIHNYHFLLIFVKSLQRGSQT